MSKINVSALHHLKRETRDEEITHFAQTLEKWFDFNCTQHFDDLRLSIGNQITIQSLPQIVHRKDELIAILIENLKREGNGAQNVVLELIVSLARDLQTDFYPYFSDIFVCLKDLLNTTDTELIENIFVCLTFLLKYLSKYIIKDFAHNYKLLSSLLTSKKDFIRKFTSESFSFLVRKAQNKNTLIEIMFESVVEDTNLVEGVGQVLFETIKGVNNQLHSCSNAFLSLLFEKYLVIESDNLDQTIHHMLELLVEHISKDNSDLIWEILTIGSNSNIIAVKKILPHLELVIGFKKCRLVKNASKLTHNLTLCLLNSSLDETDLTHVLRCLQWILFYNFQYLSVEDIQKINNSIYFSDSLSISRVFEFTTNIFDCVTFERHILPSVLKYCLKFIRTDAIESNEFVASLKFLTQLVVTKRPRPIFGTNLSSISKYVLKFSENISDILLKVITKSNDLKMIWCALICLPHLIGFSNEKEICQTIANTVMSLELKLDTNYSQDLWLSYVIVESVIALIILKGDNSSIHEFPQNFFVDLIRSYPTNTEILQAFDLYLTFNQKFLGNKVLDLSLLEKIYCHSLEKNLSSFSKTKRLLTLHILTLFNPPLPPSEEINSTKASIFNICFEAESVSADLHEYREKIKYLQNLDFSFVRQSIPLTTSGGLSFEYMPIHYLLGALYENFSLLWQPIQKLIEGYAKGYDNKKYFFDILLSHFKETTAQIYSNDTIDSNNYETNVQNYFELDLNDSNSIYNSERADYLNHRILVLKTIEMFAEVIEPRNREFVNLFLDFIHNEMNVYFIFGSNSCENIAIDSNEHIMDIDSPENEFYENNTESKKPLVGGRILWKTLFSFLSVFSKFKNPKALFREPELLELYLNMLSSPDSQVQKHSLNCIFTYNHSYLSLYRDNLLRLIDEKTFKTEIHSFLINSETDDNVLRNEHRSNVVPLLMRILYGKMMSTNGTKRHGKNNSDFRRSLILKVLCAFNQNELILFMDFIFAPIIEFVRQDYQILRQSIEPQINIEKFIPLRQFQALVTTLLFVMKHFGNNSKQITSYIYKVLIVASYIVTYLLSASNRKSLKDFSISRLKAIRSNCFKVATNFFNSFDSYAFSHIEIDALFESLIWPMLPNLDTESLASPSPLLGLFISWSQNPRYFVMFSKHYPSDKNLSPIHSIVKLYSNPKVHTSVITAVTAIIENLLIYEDFSPINEENIEIAAIEIDDSILSFDERVENKVLDLNYGSALLLPFTSQILSRIRSNFNTNQTNNKSKQRKENKNNCGFNSQELNILSRLSAFVTTSEECKSLIDLLIFSINTKKNEEEKELQTSKALSHLVSHLNVNDVKNTFKQMIPLFGHISSGVSRSELCNTLKILGQIDGKLSLISEVISKINAFNPKFPEEPDFNTRLDGFKTINSKTESTPFFDLDSDYISIITHNCSYFIRSCDDMAIREASSYTIKNILNKFGQSDDNQLFNRYCIKYLLYYEIHKGLKHKSETVRHEFIEILLSLVEYCRHKHPILQQLALLSNSEDQEIDFWLNIKHIQLHRRARALSRLAKNHELLDKLSNKIFVLFLFPITTSFLNDVQYTKQTSLMNSSIEALGAFCRYVQWSKYDSLLKYYIKLLIAQKGDQKMNIKIISSILDNFSFGKTLPSNVNSTLDNEQEVENENISKENLEFDDDLKSELNTSTITKIYDSTFKSLLPLLHQCLHQKSQIDFAYDSMKKEFPEDDDIQRAPIALAIIKLLKSMNTSDDILESNLPSVFLRLCQFLQSRTQSIRESARNTFIKVMQCLGPHYFKYALSEMRATLSRGYQRHVFIYTVHAILSNLVSQLRSGDLDNCLDSLIEICNLELFGSLAEEKDVSQITTKLKEAKKCKSYEIYQILARFVSENKLTQLLIPLKTVLSEAHSYKVVRKVSQSLSKIGQGLISNKDLSEKTIMLFIYGVINNVIPHMQLKTSQIKKEKLIKKKPQKPDSYLIPKQSLQRVEKVVKINEASNAHIIVEFALNCFQALMKQNRMQSSNEEHLSLLDPYIPLLENLLDSKDSKLTTVSLQCLYSLYTKFSILPSFTKQSEKIIEKIFLLLHKYAGLGMNDNDNVQLVLLCFKTISLFIKDRTDVKISDDQMAVLLSYIDQDLNDDTRQSTAFVLLKSILSRKYNSPALHKIMKKLSEMSITCEIDHIRNNCLHLCIKYLTEYPNGNRLKRQINFFIRHLEYEKLTGRESAVNLLKSLISSLSYEFLSENIGLIFVPLSSRLLNESSPDCKKLVADSIVILLKRLKEEDRYKIFNEMIIPWLQEEGALERHLASHLCSLFINVEEKNFIKRFLNCLPFIKQQLDPDRYETSEQNSDNALVKVNDSLVYQHLNVILKLMRTDSNLMDKNRYIDDINSILEYIQSFYLLHPHVWVRVISTQIFGQLFSHYSIECLANAIKNPSESNAYLLNNTNERLTQLGSKFCLMFRDIYEAQALSDQLIKNLVYIARVIILASDQNQTSLILNWMTNKLMFEVKYELKTNPNLTKKRICVFKWIAAVAVELGSQRLETYLPNFLPPLCREDITTTKGEHNLTDEENELSILTKQVIQLIKNIVGSEKFTDYYAEARTKLTLKRLERKKNRALEV